MVATNDEITYIRPQVSFKHESLVNVAKDVDLDGPAILVEQFIEKHACILVC
jgi:hypothetical protein